MSLRRCLAALLLASAALAVPPAQGQVGPTHEVRRGDTLFAVARKTKHDGVSRNQMIVAIWRANQDAFPGGNINVMEVGTILNIPPRATVAAIDPAEADRQVREILAKYSGAQVASAKPPAAPASAPAKPAAAPSPGLEAAAKRYREGEALERRGNDEGAFRAYLEAGEAGYGQAQRKLGQIYDKGNKAVSRDYQASLKWYQKAREQGVEVDKPLQRIAPVTK